MFRTAGPNLISTTVTPLGAVALIGRSDVNGVLGGGQAGYNWQRQNWLLGIEADLQASDERSNGAICTVAGCPPGSLLFNTSYRLDWFGTLRGRVGFLPTQQLLLYATGGLAYGHIAANEPTVPLSWGDTRAGWTVGVGGEVALGPHWSIKLEYLYISRQVRERVGDGDRGHQRVEHTGPGLQHRDHHDNDGGLQYPLHR